MYLKNSKISIIKFFATTLVLILSCSKENHSTTKLVAFENTIWPKTGETYNIPVCFEESIDDITDYKTWTYGIVKKTWESNSLVRFTGWHDCDLTEQSVRIKFTSTPEKESTPQVGTRLLGSQNGIEIPIHFGDKTNSHISIMHMFGHILGFAHGHLRNNKCPNRLASGIEFEGGLFLTDYYDMDSIMNFCRNDLLMKRELSWGDLDGLQKIYGQ